MSRRGRLRKRMRLEDIDDVQEKLEELEEETEPQQQKAPAAAAKPEDRVLDLQKAAGNRATGAAIQRWAGPVMMASGWPKTNELRIGGLVLPIEAFSDAETMRQPGGATKNNDRSTGPGDVSIVLKQGTWMTELYRRSREGKGVDKAEILIPLRDGKGQRWILTEVEIVSISAGSDAGEPMFTLSLAYKKRAFADTPR